MARANRPVILFLTDGAWTSSVRYLLPELLLFGGVGFHVLPQGAGISVALCTAGHLTRVRLLDKHGEMRKKVRSEKGWDQSGVVAAAHRLQMRALVLGSVAGVAEGLVAARVLAQVGLLPRVAPQVDLQVF